MCRKDMTQSLGNGLGSAGSCTATPPTLPGITAGQLRAPICSDAQAPAALVFFACVPTISA